MQNSYGFGCCETCAKITGNKGKTHTALSVVKLAQNNRQQGQNSYDFGCCETCEKWTGNKSNNYNVYGSGCCETWEN